MLLNRGFFLAALACAALLVGCTSGADSGDSETGETTTASGGPMSVTAAPSPSASASPSATATAAPESPAPSSAAASVAPTPTPDAPTSLPSEQSVAAEDFERCSEQYLELSANITVTAQVTPVIIEGWTQSYQDAAALAAEGDDAGAAAQCWETVAAISAALG